MNQRLKSCVAARGAPTLAVAFFALLATAPVARAVTINYVFEPGTNITVVEANPPSNTYTETITGSFTFNTSGSVLSMVDVTLSGAPSYFGTSPITFLYSFSPFTYAGGIGLAFAGNDDNSSYLVALQFSTLGGDNVPLVGGAIYNGQGGNNAFATAVSGGVQIATTPAPAALPLFVTGLSALGLLSWRRKKKTAPLVT